MTSEDTELLRLYVESKSEVAFRELVRRRIGLVFSVALRQARDPQRAEDATQAVFVALARHAASLAQRPALVGWLYQAAHNAGIDILRREICRKARERKAHAMQQDMVEEISPVDWEKIRPLLDEITSELDAGDRDAVLLRYFDERSFAEIGRQLRLTENAARMRVQRALDKLYARLSRRGVTSTATALALALAKQGSVAAPPGLAAVVNQTAFAAGLSVGPAAVLGGFLGANQLPAALAALAVLGLGAAALHEMRASRALTDEVALLGTEAETLEHVAAQNRAQAAAKNPRFVAPAAVGRAGEGASASDDDAIAAAAAGMKRQSAWRNLGRESPEAALETVLWAGLNRDYALIAELFTFTPAGQRELAAWFATLSPAVRQRLRTPESAIAPVFAAMDPLLRRMDTLRQRQRAEIGFRIVGRKDQRPGLPVILEVLFTFSPDAARPEKSIWINHGDGWRNGPMHEKMVSVMTDRIDPATGNVLPERDLAGSK